MPPQLSMLFFILIVFVEFSSDFKRLIQLEGIDLTKDFQFKKCFLWIADFGSTKEDKELICRRTTKCP